MRRDRRGGRRGRPPRARRRRRVADPDARAIRRRRSRGRVAPARRDDRAGDPNARSPTRASRSRDLDAIAVTCGPGLVGALLVGVETAKALAFALGKPLVGVNHLAGHLAAAFLERPSPPRRRRRIPHLALLVSGGHTALIRVDAPGATRLLGATRDDAAGEAFDKVGKLLGLGYPGGVAIDRLAATGNPRAVALPRALAGRDDLDFSFSGLKTAVATLLATRRERAGATRSWTISARAFRPRSSTCWCASRGGRWCARGWARWSCAAASRRTAGCARRWPRRPREDGFALHIPPPKRCTDNAAMIAAAGTQLSRAACARGSISRSIRACRSERPGRRCEASQELPLWRPAPAFRSGLVTERRSAAGAGPSRAAAKKSWGQNFLHDRSVLARIVAAAGATRRRRRRRDRRGAGDADRRRSRSAAPAPRRILAVERDPDMLRVLAAELGGRARASRWSAPTRSRSTTRRRARAAGRPLDRRRQPAVSDLERAGAGARRRGRARRRRARGGDGAARDGAADGGAARAAAPTGG